MNPLRRILAQSPAARVSFALILAVFFLLGSSGAFLAAAEPQAQTEQPGGATPPGVTTSYGLSIYGELKYPPGFTHFDYANPNAPKDGTIRLSAIGTFDSLNPFILKGVAAAGIGLTFQTLLYSSGDEASAAYGLLAKSVELPADRSWVIFNLRPEARFSDSTPVTADDVVFSFNIIMTKGNPFYREYYASVLRAVKLGPYKVKFEFKPGGNRELPYILGEGLPIVSKAFFAGKDFAKTTLKPVLGSGPYVVGTVDPGRSITYKLLPNYWGKDLPTEKGRYNFATVRYDYYRDETVALQAFKAGEYDFRMENTAKVWATGYDFPALHKGLVIKKEIPNEAPTGMQGLVFNIRRDIFKDRRVRLALSYAFDFEWMNRTLFFDAYTRTKSYFSNTELASHGLPTGEELKILDRFRGKIPDEVFTKVYEPPSADVPGGIRTNLRIAQRLLRQAGWEIHDNRLINVKTGQRFSFEILLVNPAFERVAAPFVANLRRLGIDATYRTVDTSQYQRRLDNFDYDMIFQVFGESLSPGNEQRDYWSSQAADTLGSQNYVGIHNPVVDDLVNLVISAPNRQALIARGRALDRVLLWGYYVIPNWHVRVFRVAYWNKFGQPAILPKYTFDLFTWWIDPKKAAQLAEEKAALASGVAAGGVHIEPRPVAVAVFVLAIAFGFWLRRRARRAQAS